MSQIDLYVKDTLSFLESPSDMLQYQELSQLPLTIEYVINDVGDGVWSCQRLYYGEICLEMEVLRRKQAEANISALVIDHVVG